MALFRPLASSRSDQVLLLSFAIRAPNHGGAQAALHSRNRYRANLFRGFQVLAGVWLCGWGLDETVRRTLKKKKRKRIAKKRRLLSNKLLNPCVRLDSLNRF